jgi:uncharacterized iron-regulated membrane protein
LKLQALVQIAENEVPAWETITLRLRPARGGGAREGGATVLSVKESGAWPRFATTQLSLDPFTGKILRREAFADYTRGSRVRSWLRFLHTGEALGWPGQLLVATASLGALLLAWTGFALAWRRLSRRLSAAAGSS